ncbi:FtsX-like permease family protein [Clostridium sp. YIM B02515]|uniref:FtsX-like permease family protein n=1 Tax=Clostridium rhizosphaerae TaxID=2803861 RepID=A0ABS1TBP2_9CLOT|nr:FtsX-like permease family protein [Clostridium rhizosphaerae]MBL4936770.1 FtsX-like permease family protein [Clostridium rhizosphaerae]
MALIKMVLRKMVKNKWFIIFLMIGLLICSALMSSIPMYTDAVLQKVFIKDLENYQKESEAYPGGFTALFYLNDGSLGDVLKDVQGNNIFENDNVKKYFNKYYEDFIKTDEFFKKDFQNRIGIKVQEQVVNYSTEPRKMVHDNFKAGDFDDNAFARIQSLSNIEKHIKIVDGRLPANEKTDNIYEVMITEGALSKFKMVLNRVYVLSDVNKKGIADIKIKPVGVVGPKEEDNLYWSGNKISNFNESIIINEDLMIKDFVKAQPTQLDSAKWYSALDYHDLSLKNINKLYSGEYSISKDLSEIRSSTNINFPLKDLTTKYLGKEKQLKTMMWSLNVPVIIMLSIYLFMVSKLIIEKEKNEISLLISRGASRLQVVFGYVIEGMILALFALAVGPLLGLYLTKLLGASNGFLEFVNRKALEVKLSGSSYIYALAASGIFLLALLIPAYKASRTSIVDHKRKKARGEEKAFWQKLFLDFILLGVSAYGYYTFVQRQKLIKTAALSGSDVQVDPILFFVPVLFILGASLLFLRLYPYILKLIYKLGKRFWKPSMYGTLIQVSRSSVSYHFLMVFIMLTLSIGIFSATAARTINTNDEEKIEYKNGADIAMKLIWDRVDSGGTAPAPYGQYGGSQTSGAASAKTAQYIEPPFDAFEKLPGVEHAARVFKKQEAFAKAGNKSINNANLMAVDPYDYGNVVWYRNGLLHYHINEYLNLLSSEEAACIISSSISESTGAKAGDSITVSWNGNKEVKFNVYAVLDYWPSNLPEDNKKDEEAGENKFIVTNLNYIQDNFPKEPYEVWLKLKKDASREELYKAIADNKFIIVSNLVDTKNDIVNLKNNPSQLAVNGSLTMGFIISGVVCFLGFILYWVLSLKERNLQFGVLRAIGLSSMQLKLMMIWEQLLTSGIAMIIGSLIGLLCSKIYVVFFQLSEGFAQQIPPFKIMSYLSDRLKVYGFIGFTFILGLGILIYLLSKIKISNVIKLGED